MKIVSIEPTPSPNSMKLNMDESLPEGKLFNFNQENKENAPKYIQRLLEIEGVKGIFQVNDFIAVERNARVDWKQILAFVREIFDQGEEYVSSSGNTVDTFGEIKVSIQVFKGIPIQIKLSSDREEVRVGLPEQFSQAVLQAQASSENVVLERQWIDKGVRYGELDEVGKQVKEELSAAYPKERLEKLAAQAFEVEEKKESEEKLSLKLIEERLDDPDWKIRYAAIEQLQLTEEELPLLEKAICDPKMSIRRLATAYLPEIGGEKVFSLLYKTLEDTSAVVRRTAGDALSDIGNPIATEAMIKALKDSNKLVRWRAARFLYELGDETAIPALRAAQNDPEFEVSLQVKIALERIEGGDAAQGTVWQQMTKRNE